MKTPFPAFLVPSLKENAYTDSTHATAVTVIAVDLENRRAQCVSRIGSGVATAWHSFDEVASDLPKALAKIQAHLSALASRAPLTATAVRTGASAEQSSLKI